jgi:PAS domain S-box-containing protein
LNVDAIQSLNSSESYQLFFENAPDGVVLIDQFNTIQFWNPKAEAIFGWASHEVLGKIISHVIVPEEFREAHDSGMKRYLATGEVRVLNKTIEVPALHRSGKEFFIALTISTIALNGLTNFLAFIRDITEQKQSRAELEQTTLELQRSNQRLQEFASIASHDLKEPLRKIATYADLIITSESGVISDSTRLNLEKITGAATRMRQLTDGILAYSSVGSATHTEQCSLATLLSEALINLEASIRESGAIVQSDSLPMAQVVPVQIQQLFQNLISNAIKFTKRGDTPVIQITHQVVPAKAIQIEDLKPAKSYLQLSISDNGIGFHSDASEKIFGLFQRLHSKAAYEGSGLGLAICRKIVENHGGTISATSVREAGSVFTITLPHEA